MKINGVKTKDLKKIETDGRGKKACIVVPCYNESKRLSRLNIGELIEHFYLLFVNDGSSDGTLEALENLARISPQSVSILNLEKNQGKSEAVRRGFNRAISDHDLIGFMDCDSAVEKKEITAMAQLIQESSNMAAVIGVRPKKALEKRSLKRRVGSAIVSFFTKYFLQLPYGDTQCGLKIFRNDPKTQSLFHRPFRTKWLFDIEILCKLKEEQVREFEINSWVDSSDSKMSMWDLIKSPLIMIKLFYFLRVKPS